MDPKGRRIGVPGTNFEYFPCLTPRVRSFSGFSAFQTSFLEMAIFDTSVQKSGFAGMSGCLEHTGGLTLLLREAKESKGHLIALWLDLTNAYGSMPHKLVEEALTRNHVPSSVYDLIANSYDNFWLRVGSGSTASEWQTLLSQAVQCLLSYFRSP